MEKRENLSSEEYAVFAEYCNEKGLRIEIYGNTAYALEEWEKTEDGRVVPRFGDGDYVETIRARKIAEIGVFDASEEVNGFVVDGKRLWLDKNTRMGLRMNIADAIAAGDKVITLWADDYRFCLSPVKAERMLKEVEKYAKECYEATARHKTNVRGMGAADDIKAYDYRTGYPPKLSFDSGT